MMDSLNDTNKHGSESSSDVRDGSELDAYVAELVDRITSGEVVDFESELNKYPQHAAQLQPIFAGLMALSPASKADQSKGNTAAVFQLEGAVFGDFRIVREIGRGGMGIVYEAVQLSVKRRVALKIYHAHELSARTDPLKLTADLKPSLRLKRFQNEARTAASLDHPHIVPVYGMGNEGTLHYYAMQFIDGWNWSEYLNCQTERVENSGSLSSVPVLDQRQIIVQGSKSRKPCTMPISLVLSIAT